MTPITTKDITEYITMVRVNFPDAFPTKNINDEKVLIVSWFKMLQCYPKEVCDVAVINAIKHFEFGKYPKINDVIREAEKLRTAYEKSDTELWAELTDVLVDVRHYAGRLSGTHRLENGYTQGEIAQMWLDHIFNELSPELKEYCQTASGLIRIAQCSTEQFGYERNTFLKLIPTLRERSKVRQSTPAALENIIKGVDAYISIGNKKMIGAGNNE